MADRLAAYDFVAIVPDLFEGKIANLPIEARTGILHNTVDDLAHDAAVNSFFAIITTPLSGPGSL